MPIPHAHLDARCSMAESVAIDVDGPHQPRSKTFSKRSFGNKTVVWRSFQPSWFDNFPWLHYDERRDVAYCFVCMRASKEKKLATKCTDQAFIYKGFYNWMDATVVFNKHKKTRMPQGCRSYGGGLTKVYKDCGEMLCSQHAKEKADNRQLLYKVLTNVQYLARQGLPL